MLCGISGYVATQWNVVTLWKMLNGCCAEVLGIAESLHQESKIKKV